MLPSSSDSLSSSAARAAAAAADALSLGLGVASCSSCRQIIPFERNPEPHARRTPQTLWLARQPKP
jgi:hypothetical protein